MDAYSSVAKTDQGELQRVFKEVQSGTGGDDRAAEKFVEEVLRDIEPDSSAWKGWSDETRRQAMTALKMLSRQPAGSKAMNSPRGVALLMTHGGLISYGLSSQNPHTAVSSPTAREVLRCLSNCLLQHPEGLKTFEENDGIVVVLRFMKKADNNGVSAEEVFIYTRLLLISTATSPQNVRNIVDKWGGVDILAKCIEKHVGQLLQPCSTSNTRACPEGSTFSESTLVGELFKVMFSIQHHYRPPEAKLEAHAKFESILQPAIRVLTQYPTPRPLPLVPPTSSALHILLEFPVKPYRDTMFPEGDLELVNRLLDMLKDSLAYFFPNGVTSEVQDDGPDEHVAEDADDVVPPLVIVLTKIVSEDKAGRELMKKACLPTERSLPVDKGESFSAQLIRLLTSVRFQKLKDTVGCFLFSVCNEDVDEFVNAVGYGNAAGFLVMNNIPYPVGDSSARSTRDRPHDMVTGQYLDLAEQARAELAAMTDEEKEREAERLFVLFERLNKTGVITAENPIGKAVREGKLSD